MKRLQEGCRWMFLSKVREKMEMHAVPGGLGGEAGGEGWAGNRGGGGGGWNEGLGEAGERGGEIEGMCGGLG